MTFFLIQVISNFNELSEVDDLIVREFAKRHEYTIVTQDSDFYDIAIVKGIPPKIIWIRSGNYSTRNIEQLLRNNALVIQHFGQDKNRICLELL